MKKHQAQIIHNINFPSSLLLVPDALYYKYFIRNIDGIN